MLYSDLKYFHLLFQCFIHFFRNSLFEGSLQSLVLHCFLQDIPSFGQRYAPLPFFLPVASSTNVSFRCFDDTDHLFFTLHFLTSYAFAHRNFFIYSHNYHLFLCSSLRRIDLCSSSSDSASADVSSYICILHRIVVITLLRTRLRISSM